MKRYERLSYLFAALAVLLSNVMCAVVAYDHCAMQWGERYAGYSVPAHVAFLSCIPYGIAIMICVIIARFFYKKYRASL